jgi:hypothetical protein
MLRNSSDVAFARNDEGIVVEPPYPFRSLG